MLASLKRTLLQGGKKIFNADILAKGNFVQWQSVAGDAVSLKLCWGVLEAQAALIVTLSSSGLLGSSSSSTDREPGPQTRYWYFWQCVQVPSPAGEGNQHSDKAGEQKETWRALKTVLVESALTLGLMEPNGSRWHGSSTITETPAAGNVCVSTPPPDSGTLRSKLNAIFTKGTLSSGPVRVTSDGVSGSGVPWHQACPSFSWCPHTLSPEAPTPAAVVSLSIFSSCLDFALHPSLGCGCLFSEFLETWITLRTVTCCCHDLSRLTLLVCGGQRSSSGQLSVSSLPTGLQNVAHSGPSWSSWFCRQ